MEILQDNYVYNINKLLLCEFKNKNIMIYGTWEEPLFKASEIGEMLSIKQIRKSIQNIDDEYKRIESCNTNIGSREQYFLTEQGLYELLFVSRKEIAKQFKKHVCALLVQARLNLKSELEEYKERVRTIEFNTDKHKEEQMREYEDKLLKSFQKKNVIYLVKVEENDEHMIIKFGSSDDIVSRMKKHHKDYKNSCLLDAFAVLRNRRLEQDMLSLMSRQKTIYELYPSRKEHLIFYKNGGGVTYQEFKQLISNNISDYNSDPEQVISRLQHKIDMLELKLDHKNKNENTIETVDVGVQCCLIDTIDGNYTKSVQVGRGPHVQKIEETERGFIIIATYNSISEACRRNGITIGKLRTCVKNKALLNGYRWYFVKRTDSIHKMYDIGQTRDLPTTRTYTNIVKVTSDNKSIVEIYDTQQKAASCNDIKKTKMMKSINGKILLHNYYYYRHTELPSKLLEDDYNSGKYTIIREKGHEIKYRKLYNDEIIEEYYSQSEVVNKNNISTRVLKKLLNSGKKNANGFTFVSIDA